MRRTRDITQATAERGAETRREPTLDQVERFIARLEAGLRPPVLDRLRPVPAP